MRQSSPLARGLYPRSLINRRLTIHYRHIFCLDCARKTQFTSAAYDQRTCPVCQTALPNQDDAVQTRLAPSEDYKTSVLSGLDPPIIMECASRALGFWTYQTTQEMLVHRSRIS
jgi:hypothetical protein